MNGKKNLLIAGIFTMIVMPATAISDDSENIIKYRQAIMKAIGGHMSASSLIVRGKVSYKALKEHATALKILTADIPGLFPDDSDFGETRAKEEVWGKRAAFEKAAGDAKKSIEAYAAAVESGKADAISAKFKDVGEGCKGCHKDFRQKEE